MNIRVQLKVLFRNENNESAMIEDKVNSNYIELFDLINSTFKDMMPDVKDKVLKNIKLTMVEQKEFKALMKLKANKSDVNELYVQNMAMLNGKYRKMISTVGDQLEQVCIIIIEMLKEK